MKPLSQRAYARHRGCRLNSVQEAIRAGRLVKSLVRVGKVWQIRDPEAADREWEASTLANRIPTTGPAARGSRAGEEDPDLPSLAESRQRREAAEARLAELELEVEEGKVIPAADVEALLVTEATRAKTKLLGIPSRARQQDPTLSAAQLELIESLIRGALEDLATTQLPTKKRKRAAAEVAP